jgi:hypothetical protein
VAAVDVVDPVKGFLPHLPQVAAQTSLIEIY